MITGDIWFIISSNNEISSSFPVNTDASKAHSYVIVLITRFEFDCVISDVSRDFLGIPFSGGEFGAGASLTLKNNFQ